jgi:hypothetical protein
MLKFELLGLVPTGQVTFLAKAGSCRGNLLKVGCQLLQPATEIMHNQLVFII